MIIQFQTRDVTFFDEDRAYFEQKLQDTVKFLGNKAGDEDSVHAHIKIEKDKHHSGEKFHSTAHITSPHGGDFYAEADSENIQALADLLKDSLERQMRKFHTKHMK